MEAAEWKKDYCIGNELIDDAHEKLFSILRRIIKICNDSNFKKNQYICTESLKYLKSYAQRHFSEEEELMRKIGYSKYDYHKGLHDRFKNDSLYKYEKKLEASDYSRDATLEYICFFADWLKNHIMVEDKKIASEIK